MHGIIPFNMGFIEELRRQRTEAEVRGARERAEADERFQQRMQREHDEEERKNAQKAIEDRARRDALETSVVLRLVRELAEVTEKSLLPLGVGILFIIDKKTDYPSSGVRRTTRYFEIEGQVDGSVRIGDRTLTQYQASISSIVDSVLEKAYHHPAEKVEIEPWAGREEGHR